jgi:hypothetical protein
MYNNAYNLIINSSLRADQGGKHSWLVRTGPHALVKFGRPDAPSVPRVSSKSSRCVAYVPGHPYAVPRMDCAVPLYKHEFCWHPKTSNQLHIISAAATVCLAIMPSVPKLLLLILVCSYYHSLVAHARDPRSRKVLYVDSMKYNAVCSEPKGAVVIMHSCRVYEAAVPLGCLSLYDSNRFPCFDCFSCPVFR